ncbi:MAG: hypothetical protein M1533_03570 [Candidatus Thermoplasmatota archaeon]|nr:hypothetical protein [Candidatus Thermoplasmatota archaeon]
MASTLYLALGGFFSAKTSAVPSATLTVSNTSTSTSPTYSITIGGLSSNNLPITSVEVQIVFSGTTVTFTLSSGTWTAAGTGTQPANNAYALNGPTTGSLTNGAVFTVSDTTAAAIFPTTFVLVDTATNGGTMGSSPA